MDNPETQAMFDRRHRTMTMTN